MNFCEWPYEWPTSLIDGTDAHYVCSTRIYYFNHARSLGYAHGARYYTYEAISMTWTSANRYNSENIDTWPAWPLIVRLSIDDWQSSSAFAHSRENLIVDGGSKLEAKIVRVTAVFPFTVFECRLCARQCRDFIQRIWKECTYVSKFTTKASVLAWRKWHDHERVCYVVAVTVT